MTKTIDITPTWRGCAPIIAAGIENGGTAHSTAMGELLRMADVADRWNAVAPEMLEALERIYNFARAYAHESAVNAASGGLFVAVESAIAKAKGEC